MGNFFGNLGERFQAFMAGRNGTDRIGRWALGGAIITLIINMIVPNVICSVLSYALLFYCIYRMFSGNVAARREEEAKFDEFLSRFSRKGGSGAGASSGSQSGQGQTQPQAPGKAKQQDPAKLTIKCEQCGQSLSVPKNRGTLKVTCPKCNHQQKVKS